MARPLTAISRHLLSDESAMKSLGALSSFFLATIVSPMVGFGLMVAQPPTVAQENESTVEDALAPGWRYHITGRENESAQVVSATGVAATGEWLPGGISMDSRVASGPYQVRWSGYLRSEGRGEYQFACYVQGQVTLKIDGDVVIDDVRQQPAWSLSEPLQLQPGLHEVACEWSSQQQPGQLGMFWKGPRFDWERLPANHLLHDTSREGNSNDWAAGRTLVDSLRCATCHRDAIPMEPLAAPDLSRLAATLRPNWIFQRLQGHDSQRPADGHRTMPDYDLSRADAEALTAFLQHNSSKESLSQLVPKDQDAEQRRQSDAKRDPVEHGRSLVLSMGCLACHAFAELGKRGPYGGGDLSRIAEKRPANFFRVWLSEPAAVNRFHRMPRFELSEQEVDVMAKFLASCQADDELSDASTNDAFVFKEELVPKGQALFESLRCGSCHEPHRPHKSVPIQDSARFGNACGGEPDAQGRIPGYRLNERQLHEIEVFLNDLPKIPPKNVELTLARNNCSACHKRSDSPGIASYTTDVFERYPELAKDASALHPPSLDRVGDKLFRESMTETLRRGGNRRRPWLKVRMPVYAFDEAQRAELVDQLIAKDRMPSGLSPTHDPLPPEAIAVAGPRLITTTGFGCSSCHAIGAVEPPPGPLNARGPSLSMIGEHVREDWFRRWVANPARFEPGMEMPSIQLSVDGVLDGDLDRQLTAVWQTLNQPGFEPPLPDPVRVVRHSGLESSARTHVFTDVIRYRGTTYVKPFVMGFGNRHNLLIDVGTARLAHWWAGDAMRQHTEGKTWFWEPGGTALWNRSEATSDWELIHDRQSLFPVRQGQFVTELQSWEHIGATLKFEYRLVFGPKRLADEGMRRSLQFVEAYEPYVDQQTGRSGWTRRVTVRGLDDDDVLRYTGFAPTDSGHRSRMEVGHDRSTLEVDMPQRVRFEIESPDGATFDEALAIRFADRVLQDPLEFSLRATTRAEIDAVHLPPLPRRPKDRVARDVVPGFEGWELPIRADWMPTALAWDGEGRLFVSSLKGRIWRVVDRDQDGWEDDVEIFSDELAAPFGLAAHESGVDVINKFALLRLTDRDGDGRADVTSRLASGWGHTADYHDWSVGLPQDAEGNYYIATSCQQDDRTEAAAHWRGKVLRLAPQSDGTYQVEEISAGHRFPIGIALREDDQLFVTDNQGNYNPFNELNHVIKGARYGFINRLERDTLPTHEAQSPAIKIPHPWTRSVNGICFLDGSADGHSAADRRFGPFTGHLVGCEYDTRRLVRMSLQEVAGQFQGAVYPFSDSPDENEPALLGPLACAVSPSGELYVGSIRDSGWGGANNIGGLVRLRFRPDLLPCGIAEVRATPDGFRIEFTRPVSRNKAKDKSRYRVSAYRRVPTPAYGGPDVDRRTESEFEVEVDSQGNAVELRFDEMREGFVYEFSLDSMVDGDKRFYPTEAFYSLNRRPVRQQK